MRRSRLKQTRHLSQETLEAKQLLTAVGFASHPIQTASAITLGQIQSADIDNDGDVDVYTSNAWLENNGSGDFSSRVLPDVSPDAERYTRRQSRLVDFDGDGDIDIVTATRTAIQWQENLGNRTFAPYESLVDAIVSDGRNFLVADFEGDGDYDFAYDTDEDYIEVRFNQGGDLSTPVRLEGRVGGDGIENIAATDLGNNGYLDLLIAADDGGTFDVFRGSANGFSSSQRLLDRVGNEFVLADMDNDADDDLVIYDDGLVWYEQDDTGEFTTRRMINPGRFASSTVADIDGDGDIDVFSCGFDGCEDSDTAAGWFLNDGGNFSTEAIPVLGVTFDALEVADIDQDGLPEMIVNRTGYELLVVRRNDGAFSDATSFLTQPSNFDRTIMADLTNDGRLDVVNLSIVDQAIGWREQLAENQFGPIQNIAIPIADRHANSIATQAADLDNDGDQDIIVISVGGLTGTSTNSQLDWYENENGKFTRRGIVKDNAYPIADLSVAPHDMDGDGDLDIVVSRQLLDEDANGFAGNGQVAWFRNEGNATFSETPIEVMRDEGDIYIHVADFDNDGDFDLAAANVLQRRGASSQGLRLMLNEGDGQTFAELQTTTPTLGNTGLTSIVSGDINSDGNVDIVLSTRDGRMLQFNNQGAGGMSFVREIDNRLSLTARQTQALLGSELPLRIGDVDGDGDADLVAAFEALGLLGWYENTDGLGELANWHVIDTDLPNVLTFALDDVDHDGDLDVVAGTSRGSGGSDSIQNWYENRPLGDVNNDGLFNTSDLVAMFQAGEYEDNEPGNSTFEEGDFDGDGEFTTRDLVLLFQVGGFVA